MLYLTSNHFRRWSTSHFRPTANLVWAFQISVIRENSNGRDSGKAWLESHYICANGKWTRRTRWSKKAHKRQSSLSGRVTVAASAKFHDQEFRSWLASTAILHMVADLSVVGRQTEKKGNCSGAHHLSLHLRLARRPPYPKDEIALARRLSSPSTYNNWSSQDGGRSRAHLLGLASPRSSHISDLQQSPKTEDFYGCLYCPGLGRSTSRAAPMEASSKGWRLFPFWLGLLGLVLVRFLTSRPLSRRNAL